MHHFGTRRMMADIFKTPRIMLPPTFKIAGSRARKGELAKSIPVPDEENLPTEIQGKAVGSLDEARVAVALDMMQLRYFYQYVINYGRQRRGGQILDFLIVQFRPYTILDVLGKYWHTGKHEDLFWVELVAKQRHWDLRRIWDYETTSVSAALSRLRALLPHG